MPLDSDPVAAPKLRVRDLAFGYGAQPVQHDVTFDVAPGSIFAIMGGSGCGKSTLLRCMIGLLKPSAGTIMVGEEDYWAASEDRRTQIGRHFGVLFQAGALWSAMTTAENVALPLQMFTTLAPDAIAALVRLKLALVGLETGQDRRPSDLSGGMRKRAGLARALALDPEVLFLDEPSAGLDPISSARLDEVILRLRDGLGLTVVMVSHELPSLLAICDDGIFLDAETQMPIAHGAPRAMQESSPHPTVQAFMNRARPDSAPPSKDAPHVS